MECSWFIRSDPMSSEITMPASEQGRGRTWVSDQTNENWSSEPSDGVVLRIIQQSKLTYQSSNTEALYESGIPKLVDDH